MSTATESVVSVALARAAVYRILGAALAYPTEPRLRELADAAATAAGCTEHSAAVRAALTGLATAVTAADADAVATEYVFLFDRQVRCAPYEGAWGDAPQLAGKAASLADIAGFYRAFGLEPSSVQADTEDHIVAELEFMSALAVKEAWAAAEDDPDGLDITRGAQRAFLTDHLGRWAGTFAAALAAATPLPCYTASAALLEAWLRAEVASLGAAPATVTGRAALDAMTGDAFTCPMADSPAPGEARPD